VSSRVKELVMVRTILFLATLVAPAALLTATAGCHEKVTTVQETEQKHESEPRMVSPGKEVVE